MTLPPDPLGPNAKKPGTPDGRSDPGGVTNGVARRRIPFCAEGEECRPLIILRLALIGLSVVGMAASIVLWIAGHPTPAARILAGDVLLILIVLVSL